jgi:hypothetical protein
MLSSVLFHFCFHFMYAHAIFLAHKITNTTSR